MFALVLASVLLWWWWPEPPKAEPTPTQAPVVRRSRTAMPPPSVPASKPDLAPDPFVPDGPEEEALAGLATALGAGLVRCSVPTDPGELSVPFPRATWDGKTVLALVEEAQGIAQIRGAPPERPEDLGEDPEALDDWVASMIEAGRTRFTVTWGEAWPGEVGWCDVEEARRVTLAGKVTLPDGSAPVEEVWVNGCDSGSVYADASGAFSFETDAGPPCTLEVRSMGMPGGTVVERSTDRDDIVVVWAERDAGTLDVLVEQARAAREKASYERDILEVALDTVPPGPARIAMRRWQEERAAKLDDAADVLAEMAEGWETEATDR